MESPELRKEGKQAANQMISMMLESGYVGKDIKSQPERLMSTYLSLASLLADETAEGYEMELDYYEKIREWHIAKGDKMNTMMIESIIEEVGHRSGGAGLFS